MIKTDIILSDDFTGEKSEFVAKNFEELAKVMRLENISECQATTTLFGMDALTTRVTLEDIEKILADSQNN